MTQEEKHLLLVDLCGRLPYGVKVLVKGEKYFNEIKEPYTEILSFGTYLFDDEDVTLVPYLRPMSSMTEEEKIQYRKTQDKISVQWDDYGQPIGYVYANTIKTYDWLNKNYFDYRGLIPMGLALEAPEGMYKSE